MSKRKAVDPPEGEPPKKYRAMIFGEKQPTLAKTWENLQKEIGDNPHMNRKRCAVCHEVSTGEGVGRS